MIIHLSDVYGCSHDTIADLSSITPAQKNAESQTPPTLLSSAPPNLTDRRSDGDDMLRIKDQVEALRRSLEQMGVQLE